jgi:hypothetical protein
MTSTLTASTCALVARLANVSAQYDHVHDPDFRALMGEELDRLAAALDGFRRHLVASEEAEMRRLAAEIRNLELLRAALVERGHLGREYAAVSGAIDDRRRRFEALACAVDDTLAEAATGYPPEVQAEIWEGALALSGGKPPTKSQVQNAIDAYRMTEDYTSGGDEPEGDDADEGPPWSDAPAETRVSAVGVVESEGEAAVVTRVSTGEANPLLSKAAPDAVVKLPERDPDRDWLEPPDLRAADTGLPGSARPGSPGVVNK